MKKLSLFVFALILVSTISALDFNIKEEYKQGEAILTKISGSFQERLQKENFEFFRNHVRIPMDYDLTKIGDDYYLYVNLFDKEPNNYSIIINDVEYFSGAKVITEDLQRNFTVTSGFVDFTINKGFIVTEDDFSITVQNLQEEKINLSYNFLAQEKRELYSGEIFEIDFSVQGSELLEIQTLELSSTNTKYEIPVYVLGIPEERPPVTFNFDKDYLNITLDINNDTKRIVYLENTGTETIFQLKLSLTEELEKYLSLSKKEFFNLTQSHIYPVEISISSGQIPETLKGNLTAISGGVKEIVNIDLKFIPGYLDEGEDSIRSCSQLGGVLCAGACDRDLVSASDGNCCLGICEEPQSDSSAFKVLGWILILVVILILAWFYFNRYKQAEGPAKGVFKFLKKE